MDRRFILAIALMVLVAVVPSFFFKPPVKAARWAGGQADSTALANRPSVPSVAAPAGQSVGPPAHLPAQTITVHTPLASYEVSTRGGRFSGVTLAHYRSLAAADDGRPAQLLQPGSDLLGLTLVTATDTVHLGDWDFSPSATRLDVTAPTTLTLTGSRDGLTVRLDYTLKPDDYLVRVDGRLEGIGPTGGLLLIGMGPGLRNTEADSVGNHREYGFVTKAGDTKLTRFSSLDPLKPEIKSGPFDWVAVKSKYFVTAIFAADSTGGRLAGVRAVAPAEPKKPVSADVQVGLPVPSSGVFRLELYAGPMEYPRLAQVGRDFDDVNPYGWPGFRTIIRPVSLGVRWLLVWMHEHLHLAYGVVLIFFGVIVRLLLWPLNQKAMRSSLQMQAVQPVLKDIQERYKNDPQRLQQEMFKVYKEHGVNPLGGCWPMLLPMPVLLALFFVFQNTIELRGAPFLWLPDLSRPDPLYIVPVVMGLSMFALTKVGQLGMPPNPQMKSMLYVMPVFMTVLFLNFASGLNLYYFIQNLASIPQQYLLARERLKRAARAIVEVKTQMPDSEKRKKR